MKKCIVQFFILLICVQPLSAQYQLGDHPRILINKAILPSLVEKARGGGIMGSDYASIKAEADWVVANGKFRNITNPYLRPNEMICTALVYLVEREMGNDSALVYAEAVKKLWGDGLIMSNLGSGQFGCFAIAYDWIYDTLSAAERKKFGDYLGGWLYHYTGTPSIILQFGDFLYNQTWGPEHLSTPHTRDGITPKLFVSLALAGAGTAVEAGTKQNMDSFASLIPTDCMRRFDLMGGVWSESMGHGTYGPVRVIPWAFEAWRTATGLNWFELGQENTFLKEMNYWAVHTTVPFSGMTACIDDNFTPDLLEKQWWMTAPILGARYGDEVANYISAAYDAGTWPDNRWSLPWLRFITYDPQGRKLTPRQAGWPTSRLFKGAGHVYMRSAWDDPDATWSFFGAGPRFAGHSLDDEGHFLIAKKGWVVLRAGGRGNNDTDYYARGSLVFNIVTIFDPNEQYAKVDASETKSERDGGIMRVDYLGVSGTDVDHRGHIEAFRQGANYTYSAADLSRAYWNGKSTEVTRQYLYLRGERDYFIIFDRVDARSASYPKHWMLHLPTEPLVSGPETATVAGHVYSSQQPGVVSWLSDPAGYASFDKSSGRSRAFLKTVLPAGATLVRRGGTGYERWGHPDEPTAQYNHVSAGGDEPPLAPWRLEVKSPGSSGREYFLHVIEIADSTATAMSDITTVVQDTSRAGLKITPANGNPIEVQFNLRGDLDAWIKMDPAGGFMQLSTGIDSTGGRTVGGDFNGDGRLGMLDALALLLRGRSNPEDPSVDFNGDGKWSLGDAVELVRYLWDGRLSLASSENLAGR